LTSKAQQTRSPAALSREQLESSLTDVRAEVYLIESERLRGTRMLASAEVRRDHVEFERLSRRLPLIEAQLEELEARTAGLRARLEHTALDVDPPGEGTSPEALDRPTG
jgi:hypothetical protein